MKKPLRSWQEDCLTSAKEHYLRHSDFFVQATPASGKTRLAAEIARWLLAEKRIDFVVCFAPTREVVAGIQRTFAEVLKSRFGDALASVGAAYTYQSMEYQPEEFWALFEQYAILVVFDEIHHCAGHDPLLSNGWGQQILLRIQDNARYTLALSGTPWRSDELPIALARYSDPEGKLICDYRYDLQAAVQDGVCRSPRITLVDNLLIHLTEETETTASVKAFSSFQQLLGTSPISYEDLLRHDDVLNAVLDMSIEKLSHVRQRVPNAGGLVVATDIEHAHQIAALLRDRSESFVVVTSQTPGAHQLIDQFRHSDTRWIIAVSMISEGTDIQRLCVCAYLSRIRTELHYRQVLGRILRRMGIIDDAAWLYVVAEPLLRQYTQRIADDLPDDQATLQVQKLNQRLKKVRSGQEASNDEQCSQQDSEQHEMPFDEPPLLTLSFSEHYRQQLLALI
ncbi:helicase-related protein [Halomonas sp. CH40]